MKPINDIDAAEVRRLFDLDIDLGVLVRKEGACPRRWFGKDVGTVHDNGYLRTRINNRSYFIHRLVWLHLHGEWPPAEIDHIDLNKANNRPGNLRCANRSQNVHNKRVSPLSSIGIKGVTFDKVQKLYRAQIKLNGKRIHLGRYKTALEAGSAHKQASLKLFGAFSCVAPDSDPA